MGLCTPDEVNDIVLILQCVGFNPHTSYLHIQNVIKKNYHELPYKKCMTRFHYKFYFIFLEQEEVYSNVNVTKQ
jgi:hypothetical protein